MKTYHCKLVLEEDMLGTVPKDKDIYKTFIASKAPVVENGEEEVETVEEMEEKGWTGFHMENGKPFIYDYMIKGFFKDACSMMRRVTKSKSSELKAHKKIIDGLIFVFPRKIPLQVKGDLGVLERPLRAATAQGERVTLVRSDIIPTGSSLEIDIQVLGGVSDAVLKEWLDYGKLRGLGQWRNGGYGRFSYSIAEAK